MLAHATYNFVRFTLSQHGVLPPLFAAFGLFMGLPRNGGDPEDFSNGWFPGASFDLRAVIAMALVSTLLAAVVGLIATRLWAAAGLSPRALGMTRVPSWDEFEP